MLFLRSVVVPEQNNCAAFVRSAHLQPLSRPKATGFCVSVQNWGRHLFNQLDSTVHCCVCVVFCFVVFVPTFFCFFVERIQILRWAIGVFQRTRKTYLLEQLDACALEAQAMYQLKISVICFAGGINVLWWGALQISVVPVFCSSAFFETWPYAGHFATWGSPSFNCSTHKYITPIFPFWWQYLIRLQRPRVMFHWSLWPRGQSQCKWLHLQGFNSCSFLLFTQIKKCVAPRFFYL